jgi:phosphinothricin acetyltransferase
MVTADTEPVSVESRQRWFDEHNSANRPLWVIEDKAKEMVGWVSFQSFYGRPAHNTKGLVVPAGHVMIGKENLPH